MIWLLSLKLQFKAESPSGFYCKLQNISLKFPFVNKYDIILTANWTTVCLSKAALKLFSHDLLLWICQLTGQSFFCLTKTGGKKMKKLMYFIMFWFIHHHAKAAVRNHYTHDMPKQQSTLMVHEMCNVYLCCTTRCVLHVSRVVSARPRFCSGNMQSLICCLSSVILPLNIMWSFCCHFSTINALEGKMIGPAGSRFMVTFSSGFWSSAPCSFLLNMITLPQQYSYFWTLTFQHCNKRATSEVQIQMRDIFAWEKLI